MTLTIEARYEAKVDRSGGPDACHPWTGTVNAKGYGRFWDGTYLPSGAPRLVAAHKWAYRHFLGDHGEPMTRHTCDNPPCQNLRHLVPGTHAQNMADMVERGRAVGTRNLGLANGHAKITPEIVRQVRIDRALPRATNRSVALTHGISPQTVSKIVLRQTWAHIE